MKNYDDLQRFKEKTQTLDIAFKDMSGQSHEADQSQWALLRQLTTDQEPELGSGQRIDMPQPHPIRGDEFSAPPEPTQAAPASPARGSILDSLNATAAAQPETGSSLFPPAPSAKPVSSATPLAPKATLVERQATTSLFPPSKPVAAPAAPITQPAAVAAPVPATPAPIAPAPAHTFAAAVEPPRPAAPAPSRFGALFRSRPAEPANLSKETPLKPLLEKIALCR
ncbi:cellulose biosynthesis protein BcsO [Pantoea sp. S18]|uniref:cellulose biosynthesis protein BcsO n=1 Tax=Pantoea sp. S18 TaxID=3019892 RepID=UPI002B2043CA|nr:cellulose biosynthesis protein BcsO [Pantoea sp. S18]MEA5101820.1 cellulose biosynthesis protein BcsO [Pantoea sp. S18]